METFNGRTFMHNVLWTNDGPSAAGANLNTVPLCQSFT
jgi:hypothetical protein